MAAQWFWRISNLESEKHLGGQNGSQQAIAYWAPEARV